MHAKRTPLRVIVLPSLYIPDPFFHTLTYGSAACAFPRVLYANTKGPKSSASVPIILYGEITLQVWQFVVHLPRFFLQN